MTDKTPYQQRREAAPGTADGPFAGELLSHKTGCDSKGKKIIGKKVTHRDPPARKKGRGMID